MLLIALTLVGLDFSDITTVTGTLNRLDAYTIDRAWFPVETVTTPLSLCFRFRLCMRFMPPLVLNTPVGR